MKKKTWAILMCVLITLALIPSTSTACSTSPVKIVEKDSHYEITLDYSRGISHYQMGEEYGKKISAVIPQFEALMDSYIAEVAGNDGVYHFFLSRINDIKPQINQEYVDEINGIASQLSGGTNNVRGDNKISVDEFYLYNLFPDIVRSTQCSAFSVYGSLTKNNKTMSARILDWYSGSQNQIAKLQTTLTIKNGKKSICTIGYIGYMGVISGLNDDKIFAAILDSSSGMPYSSASKCSYPLDIRYALENFNKLDQVADYLKSSTRDYTVSHLVFLADRKTSAVLENNISIGNNCFRAVRTANSELNDGIKWGIRDSIGTVNSFLLKGNLDNHTPALVNTKRWDSIKSQITSKGSTITLKELKEIASFSNGNGPGSMAEGDLYNTMTQQIIIFVPHDMHLEVFFRPKSGILPDVPVFERIRTGI